MSKWFVKQRFNKQAVLRIFLFPYAGGGPSVFREWPQHIKESVDLFVMHAPGREGRFNESPITSLSKKISILSDEIYSYLDVPHIFVGHSNGAIVALELARQLLKRGNRNLLHCIVSARSAPHLPPKKPGIHKLPYEEFVAELKESSTIPDVILNDRSMLDLFIPMLRADYGLSAGHDFDYPVKLPCNASLFWGSKDDETLLADMVEWDRYFTGKVCSREFDGDHYFINSNMEEYIREVNLLVELYGPKKRVSRIF